MKVSFNNGTKCFDVEVKKTIDMSSMIALVIGSVESCFDENGKYQPQMVQFVIMHNILFAYTDIDHNIDINELYEMIYDDEFVDSILSYISDKQYHDIRRAISESIQDKRDRYVESLKNDIEASYLIIKEVTQQMNTLSLAVKSLTDGELSELNERLKKNAQLVPDAIKMLKAIDNGEQAAEQKKASAKKVE